MSQVYVPDPAAVGQYIADAASELARRGTRVVVFAADRGYEDPSRRYASRQNVENVDVRRFPLSSFGKGRLVTRLLAGCLFTLQCILRGLVVRDLRGILVSTSPPMCSFAAVTLSILRRVPVVYWLMDLNPDQMIVLGKLKPTALPARVFEWLNRLILRRASSVVVLDRFMAERVLRKVDVAAKLTVLPPWPLERHLRPIPHDANPFRAEHGMTGKLVIMYSGNFGYSTPVTTVLQAALRLTDRKDIVFAFIGGGVGKDEVDRAVAEHRPPNVISLPYQPLETLSYSLSAADVHLVTIGDEVVGVVHPCKVYSAMMLERPILLLGPEPSHVSDLVSGHAAGWHIRHGDVDGAIRTILQIAATAAEERTAMGLRGGQTVREQFSRPVLCGRLCEIVERAMDRAAARTPVAGNVKTSSVRTVAAG